MKIDFDRATLTDKAAKFVGTFIRFEYALKEAGFSRKNGDAQVEWGRVGKCLRPSFYKHVTDSGKATNILCRPPKKQVSRDNHIDWDDREPVKNIDDLIVAIRAVRNNLLHGGKSGDPEAGSGNTKRSETLMNEAQWIIEQALCQMDEVRVHFEGKY
jgi:hypothetical protein